MEDTNAAHHLTLGIYIYFYIIMCNILAILVESSDQIRNFTFVLVIYVCDINELVLGMIDEHWVLGNSHRYC